MTSYPRLTDRQNQFTDKICSLSLASSNVTPEERGYLEEARVKITSGWDFKWSINGMNLAFKEIDDGKLSNNHLSESVKELYKELITIYGEPDPKMPLPPEEKRPKDWMDKKKTRTYREIVVDKLFWRSYTGGNFCSTFSIPASGRLFSSENVV